MQNTPSGVFRLTASAIADYFKHRCDRQFRWSVVHSSDRGVAGIGWNVPKRERQQSRPGISLLMESGNTFEVTHVSDLIADVGDAHFLWAGLITQETQTR